MKTDLIIYRYKKQIICYIQESKTGYFVKTGKPSDKTCISWKYDTLEDAQTLANEYYVNYINKSLATC